MKKLLNICCRIRALSFLLSVLIFYSCANASDDLKIGSDIIVKDNSVLSGKNIALIVNHTSKLSNGIHIVDTLYNTKGIKIKKLFAPEHGIRGDADAGKHINDEVDPVTGIPVISLYGNTRKPSKEMLDDIDVIVYDIQDVGARYYTYISTLYYAIEASAENKKKIIVLDRPNPIGGEKVEGPVLDLEFKSFVGIAELPIRHGMTTGELALFFAALISENNNTSPDLEIIKMINWDRGKYYDQYYSDWNPPSPNINTFETAVVYPGMCLFEGTNLSEGRGTYEPFRLIGAPYLNTAEVIEEINTLNPEGVKLEMINFTPVSIDGMSASPKYINTECAGIRITITDKYKFKPVYFAVQLLAVIMKLHPENFKFNNNFFDKLAGIDSLRKMLLNNISTERIINTWQNDLNTFLKLRNQYLLY